MPHSSILAPVIGLVLWSFVMWARLYATRIPAVTRGKIVYDPGVRPKNFTRSYRARCVGRLITTTTSWSNRRCSTPCRFHWALLAADEGLNTGLAWIYVGLRVLHSLVQAIANIIMLRFAVFMAASLVLLAMSVRAALVVF